MSTEVALTVHLKVPSDSCSPSMLRETAAEIGRRFKIGHVTIQLEPSGQDQPCEQGPGAC